MSVPEPSLSYLIPVENAIKDISTLRYSYIGIFWGLIIPKDLNFYFQSFLIVGKIDNVTAGENATEIRILDPDGEIFRSSVLRGMLIPGSVEFSARFDLAKFEKLGIYRILAFQNGTVITDENRYSITVSKQQ